MQPEVYSDGSVVGNSASSTDTTPETVVVTETVTVTVTVTATPSPTPEPSEVPEDIVESINPTLQLSYVVGPHDLLLNTPITAITPTASFSNATFQIYPSLPAGLTLDSQTGVISGTPLAVRLISGYTVVAQTSSGNTLSAFLLSVGGPPDLSYSGPLSLVQDTAFGGINVSNLGSSATFSISPSLPTGMSFNTSTGAISGTPSVQSPLATYTVSATNQYGSDSTTIAIAVAYAAPVITSISPNNGPTAGLSNITLNGNYFIAGTTVTVGGNTCLNPVTNSTTSITCSIPAGTVGAKAVALVSADGQTATLSNGYTYVLKAGDPDTTFGSGGYAAVDSGFGSTYFSAVHPLAGGKSLLVGTAHSGSNLRPYVARVQSDGSLDTSFGNGWGYVNYITGVTIIGTLTSSIVLNDGKILLIGFSGNNFEVIRLLSDGSVDTTFGTSGKATIAAGGYNYSSVWAATVDAQGRILIGTQVYSYTGLSTNYDINITRLTSSGALDTTFNSTGRIVFPIGTTTRQDMISSIAVQDDGKIVLGGYTQFNSASYYDGLIVRLTESGAMDTTFDSDGKLIFSYDSRHNYIYKIALTQEGSGNPQKIIAVGSVSTTASANNHLTAAVRITGAGAIDTTFGTNGYYVTELASGTTYTDAARDVIVNSNGSMQLAGYYTGASSANRQFVLKLTSAGALDTDFASSGKYEHAATASTTFQGLRFDTSGRLLLGETNTATNQIRAKLTRLTSGGVLDASFGTAGSSLFNVGNGSDSALALFLDSSTGKITLAGSSLYSSYNRISMTRLTSSGALDTSFGTNGWTVETSLYDVGTSYKKGANGKLYTNPNGTVGFRRYTSNGVLDLSYAGYDWNSILASYSSSGYYSNGTPYSTLGAFALNASDEPIFSAQFKADEYASYDPYYGGYYYNDCLRPGIGKYNATLTGRDTSFGNLSSVSANLTGAYVFGFPIATPTYECSYAYSAYLKMGLIQSDGKPVFANYSDGYHNFSSYDSSYNRKIVRYLANGSAVDATYGTSGVVTSTYPINGIVSQSDGKILVVGASTTIAATSQSYIARFTTSGAVDTSFGTNGYALFDLAPAQLEGLNEAVELSSGKILATGYIKISSTEQVLSVIRLNSDGSLDTSFSDDGITGFDVPGTITEAGTQIAIQTDGNILVSGSGGIDMWAIRLLGVDP